MIQENGRELLDHKHKMEGLVEEEVLRIVVLDQIMAEEDLQEEDYLGKVLVAGLVRG
jgi:hypothetical protein